MRFVAALPLFSFPLLVQAQGDIGIKAGDSVTVGTGMGWVKAYVQAGMGTAFRVRLAGSDIVVTKTYPQELRRYGAPNAFDRANGVFDLKDKVQVNMSGTWTPGEIVAWQGMEYQVEIPGNKTVWANASLIRFVSAPAAEQPKAVVAAGQPPKPGLVSCAGKFEGRYAAINGLPYSMTFRQGKVKINAPMIEEEAECWMGDGKLVLHQQGEPDMEIEINDDGSIQTPFGEMKKRAK